MVRKFVIAHGQIDALSATGAQLAIALGGPAGVSVSLAGTKRGGSLLSLPPGTTVRDLVVR
jgi:hypothetical protein